MAKAKKKSKRLSDAKLFVLAREVYDLRLKQKADATKIKESQDAVTAEMMARKSKTMTSLDTGLKVTMTEKETTVYDEDGLYADLTARQRPLAFDRSLDLSALTPERRTELMKLVRQALTPAEVKVCTVNKLNVDRLSQAVQDDRIAIEVGAAHTEIKKGAPYITVTEGGAS